MYKKTNKNAIVFLHFPISIILDKEINEPNFFLVFSGKITPTTVLIKVKLSKGRIQQGRGLFELSNGK